MNKRSLCPPFLPHHTQPVPYSHEEFNSVLKSAYLSSHQDSLPWDGSLLVIYIFISFSFWRPYFCSRFPFLKDLLQYSFYPLTVFSLKGVLVNSTVSSDYIKNIWCWTQSIKKIKTELCWLRRQGWGPELKSSSSQPSTGFIPQQWPVTCCLNLGPHITWFEKHGSKFFQGIKTPR